MSAMLWVLILYGANPATLLSVAPVESGRLCGEYRHVLLANLPPNDQWRVECRELTTNPLKLK